MSRYSEKHRVTPECVRPDCLRPGTVLRLVGPAPHWLCETCAAALDAAGARRR